MVMIGVRVVLSMRQPGRPGRRSAIGISTSGAIGFAGGINILGVSFGWKDFPPVNQILAFHGHHPRPPSAPPHITHASSIPHTVDPCRGAMDVLRGADDGGWRGPGYALIQRNGCCGQKFVNERPTPTSLSHRQSDNPPVRQRRHFT